MSFSVPHSRMACEPLLNACKKSLLGRSFSPRTEALANTIDRAFSDHHQTGNASSRPDLQSLKEDEAYEVAAAVCAKRLTELECAPVGRKIGFTNRGLWREYNIQAPIWGYMYNTTVWDKDTRNLISMPRAALRLEPKIEPEIVFGIKKGPVSSMTDKELVSCIEWIAHGFEIVHSIYPGWKFTAPETMASGSLHQSLLVSNRVNLSSGEETEKAMSNLSDLTVDLYRNDKLMDSGKGENALGSPLNALRYLCERLEAQNLHPRVMPGEIITTGTLTRALTVADGERWRSELRGFSLPTVNEASGEGQLCGLEVEFEFKDSKAAG